jgi:hypothetical protein
MKIHFQDANVSEEDEDGFTMEMDAIPRVGDHLHIDIDILPDYFVEYFDLKDDNISALRIFTGFGKKTVCAVVECVTHAMLSTGHTVYVEIDLHASMSKSFEEESKKEEQNEHIGYKGITK